MADTAMLRRLVKHYIFETTPNNGDGSAPCTVQEMNKTISESAKVFLAIIDELESK